MFQKYKRKNLTISQEYPLMDEIIDDFKKNRKSLSDYLCNLAVKDYSSRSTKDQQKEEDSDNVKLPRIDKIIDYMWNVKMNLADEIIRLANNKEISAEKMADIYLGVWALKIQLDKTNLIQKVVQPTIDKGLLYSKRDTLSRITVNMARGDLVDRIKNAQEEKEMAEKIAQSRRRLKEGGKDELEDYEIVDVHEGYFS